MKDTSDRVNFEAVQVALDKVTILEAAAAMGIPLRMGAQKSPFREDKKPSFSVFQGGRFFKDHANPEHSGGLMKFLMLAQPGWQKRDRVTFAMRLAGLDPNGPAPRHVPLKRSSRMKPKFKPSPIISDVSRGSLASLRHRVVVLPVAVRPDTPVTRSCSSGRSVSRS